MTSTTNKVVFPPSLKVRDFTGDAGVDKGYDVQQFVDDIDKSASLSDWDDEQSVAFATGYLKGAARVFIKKMEWNPDEASIVESWATLRPALIARFKPKATSTPMADVINEIKMKDNESFLDFADRVDLTRRMMDADLASTTLASQDYKTILTRDIKSMFLNGIDKTVRTFLMNHHAGDSVADMVEKATAYNKNKAEKPKKTNKGPIETNEWTEEEVEAAYSEAFVEQFNAWKKNPAKQFTFNPPKSKNKGRSGAQNKGGGNGNTAAKPVAELPWYEQLKKFNGYDPKKTLCHNCWTFGSHGAQNCPNPTKNKPKALSNYDPSMRKSQQQQDQGASQSVNQMDGQQQPDRLSKLESHMTNLSQSMANLMTFTRQQYQQQQQQQQNAESFPNFNPLNFNPGA